MDTKQGQHRESYDIVRKRNEVRFEQENGMRNSLEENVRESMMKKGYAKSVDESSINVSQHGAAFTEQKELFLQLETRKSDESLHSNITIKNQLK